MLCLCLREAPVLPPLPDLTLGWIRLRMQKIGLEKEKKKRTHKNMKTILKVGLEMGNVGQQAWGNKRLHFYVPSAL